MRLTPTFFFFKLRSAVVRRKQAEVALRHAELLYRHLVESNDAIVWRADAETLQFKFVSKAAEALLGYPVESWIGEPGFWQDHIHPDDRQWAISLCMEATRQMQSHNLEYRMIAADGRVVWLRDIVRVIAENGHPHELVGVMFDITERNRTEEVLRATTARLTALIENLQVGILVEDESRHIVLVNCAFCAMLRITAPPTALAGMACSQSAEPAKGLFATPDQFFHREAAILRERRVVTAEELLLADGRAFERDYIPIFVNEEYRGHLWQFRDITERKRAEEALHYRAEFENLIAGISTTFINLAHHEVDEGINQALQAIGTFMRVDRSYVFLLADNGAMINNTHKWYAPNVAPQIAVLQGIPVETIPWWMDKLERFETIHLSRVADLPDAATAEKKILEAQNIQSLIVVPMRYGNVLVGFVGFDTVRMERVWSADDGSLLKMVADIIVNALEHKRTEEELRRALEKEKEFGQLKSRFVSMASHEFRTPLTTIMTASDLLKRYSHRMTEEQKLQRLDKIQAEVNHMTQLLEDVLTFGKADAGKLEFNPAPLEVESFCREVIEEIQTLAGAEHTITFSSRSACSSAVMDKKLLRHILTNLLSNAIKYSPPGSTVQFDLFGENGTVVFRVKDQGIGIPPKDQARLFEPFHRAANVGNVSGTGLGLAIAKKAVDLHGGVITTESEVGVGTTFTIAIPSVQLKEN
jgi:PAS domain S-box-containing protein